MSKKIPQSLIRLHEQSCKPRFLMASSIQSNILGSSQKESGTTSSSSLPPVLRFYSSTSAIGAPSSSNDNSSNKDDDWALLYERDSERNKLPQAALAFSILNSSYWMWYTVDFIPTINNSPIDDLYVNPMIGIGGVTLGLLINLVTGLYPFSLVSKLGYAPKDQQLHVWKHDLFPLIKQAKEPKIYSLGTLKFHTASNDTQDLLKDSSTYTGHLGLQANDERLPMLMEVREKGELKDPQLLLQAMLLDPKAMIYGQEDMGRSRYRADRKQKQPKKKKQEESPTETAKSSAEPINIKPRYAKKNKKR
ncbi:unnamed protein product [Cylindrotheca closterium]|uniref:Uncharacterized protein n=1 Tax=Cylindrotheca closterium TaxID=2856 RepID=A0AAD2FCS8_9STRA|nr:unnamed protein product [Cylindrotheca closterium]